MTGLRVGTDGGDRWAGGSWDRGGKERRWRGGGGEGDLGRRAQGVATGGVRVNVEADEGDEVDDMEAVSEVEAGVLTSAAFLFFSSPFLVFLSASFLDLDGDDVGCLTHRKRFCRRM